jgi:hypothetical protein
MDSTGKRKEEEERETPYGHRRKQQQRRKLLAPQPVCPHGNVCRKSQSSDGSGGSSSSDSGCDVTEQHHAREAWAAETNDMGNGRCEVCVKKPHMGLFLSLLFCFSTAFPSFLLLLVSIDVAGGTAHVCESGRKWLSIDGILPQE